MEKWEKLFGKSLNHLILSRLCRDFETKIRDYWRRKKYFEREMKTLPGMRDENNDVTLWRHYVYHREIASASIKTIFILSENFPFFTLFWLSHSLFSFSFLLTLFFLSKHIQHFFQIFFNKIERSRLCSKKGTINVNKKKQLSDSW